MKKVIVVGLLLSVLGSETIFGASVFMKTKNNGQRASSQTPKGTIPYPINGDPNGYYDPKTQTLHSPTYGINFSVNKQLIKDSVQFTINGIGIRGSRPNIYYSDPCKALKYFKAGLIEKEYFWGGCYPRSNSQTVPLSEGPEPDEPLSEGPEPEEQQQQSQQQQQFQQRQQQQQQFKNYDNNYDENDRDLFFD